MGFFPGRPRRDACHRRPLRAGSGTARRSARSVSRPCPASPRPVPARRALPPPRHRGAGCVRRFRDGSRLSRRPPRRGRPRRRQGYVPHRRPRSAPPIPRAPRRQPSRRRCAPSPPGRWRVRPWPYHLPLPHRASPYGRPRVATSLLPGWRQRRPSPWPRHPRPRPRRRRPPRCREARSSCSSCPRLRRRYSP